MDSRDPVQDVQMLFVRHTDRIEGFIFALLPDFSASKDLLQETFLTVSAKAADFRAGSDFLAWARAIARNKVLKHFEQTKRSPDSLEAPVLEILADDAARMDEGWEPHRQALTTCLDRLTPRLREIVQLSYSQGSPAPREIARRISWTAGAVRVALARARKFLHVCVQQSLSTEEA